MPGIHELLRSWSVWGSAFILQVQAYRNPLFDAVFWAASALLTGAVVFIFLGALYWAIDRRIGVELLYLALLSAYANEALKEAFGTARPGADGIWRQFQPTSFSFPSGHSQSAVTTFGYLALLPGRASRRVLFIVLIPVIAFSRIYLGAHFPHDVLGGLLAGVVCLALFLYLYPKLNALTAALSPGTAIGAGLIAGVALLALFPAGPGGHLPNTTAVRFSGLFAGLNVGLAVERRWVLFSTDGRLRQRVLRLPVGGLLVGATYGVFALAFAELGRPAIVLWGQHLAVGFAVAAVAPWLFVRLGLAAGERREETKPPLSERV